MSVIVTNQGPLHYQYIGTGEPIILLHGWVNSWRIWRDSMLALNQTKKYRVYTLDFWGFGESAKEDQTNPDSTGPSAFEIDGYVEMVYQFMEALGIVEATILGHSMGGTVALKMALRHPERVRKVAVVCSPIVGTSLNTLLRLAGFDNIARLLWAYPFIRQGILNYLLYGDSKNIREMISADIQQATMESFFRSIDDLKNTDLRDELSHLTIPTLGIYGKNDNIVSPKNANWLQETTKSAQITVVEESRHFPMTDHPQFFIQRLDRFLNNGHAA
ncbi:MAG: alpha/beta hydrolase [Chloroflexota bacterium]